MGKSPFFSKQDLGLAGPSIGRYVRLGTICAIGEWQTKEKLIFEIMLERAERSKLRVYTTPETGNINYEHCKEEVLLQIRRDQDYTEIKK